MLTSLLVARLAAPAPPCRMPRSDRRLDHSRFWLSDDSERNMCEELLPLPVPVPVVMPELVTVAVTVAVAILWVVLPLALILQV